MPVGADRVLQSLGWAGPTCRSEKDGYFIRNWSAKTSYRARIWYSHKNGKMDLQLCRRTAVFWVITQRVVVISYRRFRTTYRSNLEGVNVSRTPTGPVFIGWMMMGPVVVAETSKPNYFTALFLHLLGSAGDGRLQVALKTSARRRIPADAAVHTDTVRESHSVPVCLHFTASRPDLVVEGLVLFCFGEWIFFSILMVG